MRLSKLPYGRGGGREFSDRGNVTMAMTLESMLPYLQCPRSGKPLSINGEKIVAGKEEYPLVNGKPILIREIRDFHINPPSSAIISKNIVGFTPPPSLSPQAICLHLGCGDVPSADPR